MVHTLPEEVRMLQATVRRFVTEKLLPLEKEVEERGEFPEEKRLELRSEAIRLGLWGYAAPRKYGGGGLNALADVVVHEELGMVSDPVGSRSHVLGTGLGWMGEYCDSATEEQNQRYFIPLLKGEKDAFIAVTEPDAGSDVRGIKTTAVRKGDSYVINGAKTFITFAATADFGLVYARTNGKDDRRGSLSCFIVDKDTPGFIVGKDIPLMGRRGVHSYEVFFDNCTIPLDHLVGKEGDGFSSVQKFFVRSRLNISARACGEAQRAFDMSKEYAKSRVTFGKPLSERQAVQKMLVDSFMGIFASRTMTRETAWRYDQGEDIAIEAALLKVFSTEMACKAIDRAIQIHGGVGYTKELPLEMMYREMRLFRIGEGPTEVLVWWAARQLFKR